MPRPTIRPSGYRGAEYELPGYQERNKENLIHILGAADKAFQTIERIPHRNWNTMKDAFSNIGVFTRSLNMIQQGIATPTNRLQSQITMGIERAMMPATQAITRMTSQFMTFYNRQMAQSQLGAGIGGMAGYGAGYAAGGPAGGMLGMLLGSWIGAGIESIARGRVASAVYPTGIQNAPVTQAGVIGAIAALQDLINSQTASTPTNEPPPPRILDREERRIL